MLEVRLSGPKGGPAVAPPPPTQQPAHRNQQPTAISSIPTTGNTIHVLMTSGGSAYQNYQTRIHYATFLLAQWKPGGGAMVAFTRILHRTVPDALMDEVPTFHAVPLQPECDRWCEYPVSDRPNAVRQFFDAAATTAPALIRAPWILMTEADYVWLKPVAAPAAEDPTARSIGFPFSYIDPLYPTVQPIMRRYFPESARALTDIPATGPAPPRWRQRPAGGRGRVIRGGLSWGGKSREELTLAAILNKLRVLVLEFQQWCAKLGTAQFSRQISSPLRREVSLPGLALELIAPVRQRIVVTGSRTIINDRK